MIPWQTEQEGKRNSSSRDEWKLPEVINRDQIIGDEWRVVELSMLLIGLFKAALGQCEGELVKPGDVVASKGVEGDD